MAKPHKRTHRRVHVNKILTIDLMLLNIRGFRYTSGWPTARRISIDMNNPVDTGHANWYYIRSN